MTDREVLFSYRFKEAEETLIDAERMLQNNDFLAPLGVTFTNMLSEKFGKSFLDSREEHSGMTKGAMHSGMTNRTYPSIVLFLFCFAF